MIIKTVIPPKPCRFSADWQVTVPPRCLVIIGDEPFSIFHYPFIPAFVYANMSIIGTSLTEEILMEE